MRVLKVWVFLIVLGGGSHLAAQQGELINDTLWVTPLANRPIEFSKALGKVVYIRDIIPADLPPKQRKIQLISSVSNEIDEKQIIVVNNKDIVISLELFTDRYYTLYIK